MLCHTKRGVTISWFQNAEEIQAHLLSYWNFGIWLDWCLDRSLSNDPWKLLSRQGVEIRLPSSYRYHQAIKAGRLQVWNILIQHKHLVILHKDTLILKISSAISNYFSWVRYYFHQFERPPGNLLGLNFINCNISIWVDQTHENFAVYVKNVHIDHPVFWLRWALEGCESNSWVCDGPLSQMSMLCDESWGLVNSRAVFIWEA